MRFPKLMASILLGCLALSLPSPARPPKVAPAAQEAPDAGDPDPGPGPEAAPEPVTAEPPAAPMLGLETGMHTARIGRLAIDAAGGILLTASDDKTARLWDLASGQVLQVLRPPRGDGGEGQIFACALSPDGRLAALGGRTGFQWDGACSIYLFDAATGQFLRRIAGLPARSVQHLVFSRDSSRLAACVTGTGPASGVLVFRLADDREQFRDLGYGGRSHGADFDASGRLAVTSFDGHIRLYGPDGKLLAKAPSLGGVQPSGIRFSPDGAVLAVGLRDKPAVYLFSALDLKPLLAPVPPKGSGFLASVAWSADGGTLYAAGRQQRVAAGKTGKGGGHPQNNNYLPEGMKGQLRDLQRMPIILSWSRAGRGACETLETEARSPILDLAALPAGGLLWCSGDPAWGRLGATPHQGATADFRGMALKLDRTGTRLSFRYDMRGAAFRFQLPERSLGRGGGDLSGPETGALPILWDFTEAPMLGDRHLKLDPEELSRSLAIAPGGGRFLLGTTSSLRCFDAHGEPLWSRPAPDGAFALNITGDGLLALAACGDGTIRWRRMSDGRELLAFMPLSDQKRWVLWTPSGYYDCSPGAEGVLGWVLNRGREQAADFFPVARFRAAYYRPDVIDRVLRTLDEGRALQSANEEVAGLLTAEARALEQANAAGARRREEEAGALRRAEEARARKLAEETEARRIADEAKARRLADEARALKQADEAKARKLAEQAQAMRQAIEATARKQAEEAKALQLASEARARKLAEEARARQQAEEARASRLLEEARALQLAREASLELLLPPVVAILSPTHGQTIASQTLAVRVRVHHPKDRPVDEVWAAVDGRALATRGIQVKEPLTGTGTGRLVTLEVLVPARDCVVSVLARSGQAISEAASVSLKWGGAAQTQAKGTLNVLAVGVSRYRDAALDLAFAAKDARDLAGRMDSQQGRLYGAVHSRVLLDAGASLEAIRDGLKWLGAATTERDTAVIFLAGHGMNDSRDRFFFLPHGADLERAEETMLAGADLQSALAAIPGRVVFFLDSCHSGAVMKRNSSVTRFVNTLGSAENGVVVFTASTGAQLSQESPEWNNGAFTKVLDEGLDGQADLFKKGRVTVSSLEAYLDDRVPILTKGLQTPTVIRPAAIPDFPVALLK